MDDKTRVEVTKRTISPCDLIAGDNPGTIISRPALSGPNNKKKSTNQMNLSVKILYKEKNSSDYVSKWPHANMADNG